MTYLHDSHDPQIVRDLLLHLVHVAPDEAHVLLAESGSVSGDVVLVGEVEEGADDAALVVPAQLVQHALQHRGQLAHQVGSHRLKSLVDQVVNLRVVLVLEKKMYENIVLKL